MSERIGEIIGSGKRAGGTALLLFSTSVPLAPLRSELFRILAEWSEPAIHRLLQNILRPVAHPRH
ncbi:hypothetical protein ACEQ6A_35870, partial [Rhizobium brockwellii]|uniref:hypothetical protein n=1 Tax=Rhizobium brockwellii TaxID=3019932 RepID=UPI003F994929